VASGFSGFRESAISPPRCKLASFSSSHPIEGFTVAQTKARRFRNGERPISTGEQECVVHRAKEVRQEDGSTVLIAEVRIIIDTEDGRRWNSVVDVELHNDE
jgi:hypothetical protein